MKKLRLRTTVRITICIDSDEVDTILFDSLFKKALSDLPKKRNGLNFKRPVKHPNGCVIHAHYSSWSSWNSWLINVRDWLRVAIKSIYN